MTGIFIIEKDTYSYKHTPRPGTSAHDTFDYLLYLLIEPTFLIKYRSF
jgi:retron-type reverse transcriptase